MATIDEEGISQGSPIIIQNESSVEIPEGDVQVEQKKEATEQDKINAQKKLDSLDTFGSRFSAPEEYQKFETDVEKTLKQQGYFEDMKDPIEMSDMLNTVMGGVQGLGSMNGKVMLITKDGGVVDANDFVESAKTYAATVKSVAGDAPAKAFLRAVTPAVDGKTEPTAGSVAQTFFKEMQKDGVIDPNFDSTKDVGVEAKPVDLKYLTPIAEFVKSNLEKGANLTDTAAVAFEKMKDSKQFQDMSDAGKVYVLGKLAQSIDSVDAGIQTKGLIKAAEAVTNEQMGIVNSVVGKAANADIVYSPMSSEQRTKTIKQVQDYKSKLSTIYATKAKLDEAVQMAEITMKEKWSPANFSKVAAERGRDVAYQLEAIDKQKVENLKQQKKQTDGYTISLETEANRLTDMAVRGVPLSKIKTERMVGESIVAQASRLQNPQTVVDEFKDVPLHNQPIEQQQKTIAMWMLGEAEKEVIKGKDEARKPLQIATLRKLQNQVSAGDYSSLGGTAEDSPIGTVMQNFKTASVTQQYGSVEKAQEGAILSVYTDAIVNKDGIGMSDVQKAIEQIRPTNPALADKWDTTLKTAPVSFSSVLANPKASKSMKKGALGELEKESATVASKVAGALNPLRPGAWSDEGRAASADEAITAVVQSGIPNEHKAALIRLLAEKNKLRGAPIQSGLFKNIQDPTVAGYGFDRLYEMHTAATKATGVYGGWTDFMDMYAALDRKLGGVAKDVTNTQKKEIVNNFIKEATDPLMNRMRAAAVSRLSNGR